jgi:F-type H+-transporting ATPase subunit delta
MLASLIAERYAKALLRAAQAEKALAEVGAQAELLRLGLVTAENAAAFLSDPVAEPLGKLKVLSSVFEGGAHPILQAFLLAALEQKRERFLPAILHKFAELRDEAEGRASVSVGTAHPLAPAERQLLEKALSKRLGRVVALQPYTDKTLLGGAVLKLGDTVFDGSLRSRLSRLGSLLAKGVSPTSQRASGAKGSAKAPAKAPAKPKPKPSATAASKLATNKAPSKPAAAGKKKSAPKKNAVKKGKF